MSERIYQMLVVYGTGWSIELLVLLWLRFTERKERLP